MQSFKSLAFATAIGLLWGSFAAAQSGAGPASQANALITIDNIAGQQTEALVITGLPNDSFSSERLLTIDADGGVGSISSSTMVSQVAPSSLSVQDQDNSISVSADSSTDKNSLISTNDTGAVSAIHFVDGKIGINTMSPDQELSLDGQASKSGGGAWRQFSDRRLKKNIAPFDDGLEQVRAINPVTYQYNGKGPFSASEDTHVGVIAQEIEAIAPYMTYTFDHRLNLSDPSPTALLGYDSSALVYILVNAVQELDRQNQALINELEQLKSVVIGQADH